MSSQGAFEQAHDWTGDALPEAESAAFQEGKAKALKKLLPYTRPASLEAASVVLRKSGEEFSFEVGQEDEVSINAPAFEPVALLHTHNHAKAHSEKDWTDFMTFPAMQQSHVVTANKTYSLHKPRGWAPEAYGLESWRPDATEGILERNLENVEREYVRLVLIAIGQVGGVGTAGAEEQIFENVLQGMARRFGILFRVGQRPTAWEPKED